MKYPVLPRQLYIFQRTSAVWLAISLSRVKVDYEDAGAARVGTLCPQSGGGQPQIFPTSGLGLIRQRQLRCGSRQFKFREPGYLRLWRWADDWWSSGKKPKRSALEKKLLILYSPNFDYWGNTLLYCLLYCFLLQNQQTSLKRCIRFTCDCYHCTDFGKRRLKTNISL